LGLRGASAEAANEEASAPDTQPPTRPSSAHVPRRNDVERISDALDRLRPPPEPVRRSVETPPHRDPLTGLWDDAYLAVLSQQLQDGPVDTALEFCVLSLALDDLEPIQARYGRGAADHVQEQIGLRLRQRARRQDYAFRLAPDSFMLWLPCPAGEGAVLARTIAQRIVIDLQRPVPYLTLSNLRVRCAVGAALWLPGGMLAESMRQAHEALKAARRAGRGQFRQFAPEPTSGSASEPDQCAPPPIEAPSLGRDSHTSTIIAKNSAADR
jgi:diguanylate cyclase (GGDEF)-like protein